MEWIQSVPIAMPYVVECVNHLPCIRICVMIQEDTDDFVNW